MSDAAQALPDLTAVILAGGLGTRLQAVAPGQQKVVTAVGARPFVTHVLDQLAGAGLRRVVLCTGHFGEQVQQVLGERYGPLELEYSQEAQPLGTGGATRQALPLISGDPVLVMNGDSFCAADLGAFLRWHHEQGAAGSLLLTHVDDVGRYGQVQIGADGAVERFVEKGAAGGPGWISAGVYWLAQRVVEGIPAEQAISIEREVFPAWVGKGLCGWPGGGRFIDIGTPAAFEEAQYFFNQSPSS